MESRRIVILLFTMLLLFIGLTVLVITESVQVQTFNETLYAPVASQIHPTWTTIAIVIGHLTHWYSYAPIILVLLIIPSTRKRVGLPMAFTLSASAMLGPIILKNIFAIERPIANQLIEIGGFGYPSGHSLNALVFFSMCAIMVLRYSNNETARKVAPVPAVIAILLVGLSRVYLGVHTITDVLGGFLMGSVVVCASVLIERRVRGGNIVTDVKQNNDVICDVEVE